MSSALDVWNGDARGITCGETRDIARDLDVCEGKREREIGKLKCRLLKNWRSQNNLRWFWPVATERALFLLLFIAGRAIDAGNLRDCHEHVFCCSNFPSTIERGGSYFPTEVVLVGRDWNVRQSMW